MLIRWEETIQDNCDAMKEWANPYLGCHLPRHICIIRECGSTLYVGMAQGVSFSPYIGIGAKFEIRKYLENNTWAIYTCCTSPPHPFRSEAAPPEPL